VAQSSKLEVRAMLKRNGKAKATPRDIMPALILLRVVLLRDKKQMNENDFSFFVLLN